MLARERGSAPVDVVFGIVASLVLLLGVIQVGLSLYVRNVVISSAHEGARAAIEMGRTVDEARAIAGSVVRRATGSAIGRLSISPTFERSATETIVNVVVRAEIRPLGLIPVTIPVTAQATAGRPRIE